jgi:hypothetical protein
MEKPRRISDEHWKFIQYYAQTGDKLGAYRHAGYQAKDQHTATVAANKLLRREDVQWALQQMARDEAMGIDEEGIRVLAVTHAEPADLGRLGSREGRAEFLARMAEDEDVSPKDRLTAAKLLGMMFGDYVARIQSDNQASAAPNIQIVLTDQDAKDVIRGKRTMQEVIDVPALKARNGDE